MKITTVGVDLAKSVFTVYGVDEHGKPALRKTVRRGKLLELFAQLPACVVGMEACSGAQHWARELRELGHTPRIMAAEFVEPYRRGGKNDTNDGSDLRSSSPGRRCASCRSNRWSSKRYWRCTVCDKAWARSAPRSPIAFAAC